MKKKLLALALALVLIFTVLPASYTDAATTVPAKVTTACKHCINENNKCVVVARLASKIYVMQKKGRKWSLVKSFNCICGDGMRSDYHYFLLRNRDTDRKTWRVGSDRYKYVITVDCYDELRTTTFHSYVQRKSGGVWKTYKSRRLNYLGISVCETNAKWMFDNLKDGTAVEFV